MIEPGKKVALELILEFARSHDNVKAVYEGVAPEKDKRAYYFIVPAPHNLIFEAELNELGMRISGETFHECDLMSWPSEEVDNGFIQTLLWETSYTKKKNII